MNFFLKYSKLAALTTMFVTYSAPAQVLIESGGHVGGGDASEKRVNEIRADLLSWINAGGSKSLTLPVSLSHDAYVSKMTQFLAPQYVVVSFTNSQEKVTVSGKEKTCISFYDAQKIPNILCEIDRFSKTAEAEQYQLIHHEYAGIADVETNRGAASDYFISDQITHYLVPMTVLKLAVKEAPAPSISKDCTLSMDGKNRRALNQASLDALKQKGYELVKSEGAIIASFYWRDHVTNSRWVQDGNTGYMLEDTTPSITVSLFHVQSGYELHTDFAETWTSIYQSKLKTFQYYLENASSVQSAQTAKTELEKWQGQEHAHNDQEMAVSTFPSCTNFYHH